MGARSQGATGWRIALALITPAVLPACSPDLMQRDIERAPVQSLLRQSAESFIAVVQSADPAEINKRLVEELEFKPYPDMGGEWYSFYWRGQNVIGPFPLEDYRDPKRLNLQIEGDGATIRVFGTHCYKRFILTGDRVSYGDGELGEVLPDLKAGGWRLGRAASWLRTHPSERAVPTLIEALGGHYEVPAALSATTYQRLENKADWERWYEANKSKSREEWRADAKRECLGQLASDDLADRIEGAKLARLVGGLGDEVRQALVFPDEAYHTSVAPDESGHVLVITNRTDTSAIIAIRDHSCHLSYLRKPTGNEGLRSAGGLRSAARTCGPPVEHYLQILGPGESRTLPITLPKNMKSGEYAVTAFVQDAVSGRRYEAKFDLSVP